MKKFHKKPQKSKYIYMQDSGTYPSEIIVSVGMTNGEVAKWMRKRGIAEWQIEEFLTDNDEGESDLGSVWYKDGRAVLKLDGWNFTDWQCHDTLIHECMHLVQFLLMDHRSMEDEKEAQAYQLEYLVRSIRERLTEAIHFK